MDKRIGFPKSIYKITQFQTDHIKKKFNNLYAQFCIYRDFPQTNKSLFTLIAFSLLAYQIQQALFHPKLLKLSQESSQLSIHFEQLIKNSHLPKLLQQAKLNIYCKQNQALLDIIIKQIEEKVSNKELNIFEQLSKQFYCQISIYQPGQSPVIYRNSLKRLQIKLLFWKQQYFILYDNSQQNLKVQKYLRKLPLAAFQLQQYQVIQKLLNDKIDNIFQNLSGAITRQQGSVVYSKFSRRSQSKGSCQNQFNQIPEVELSKISSKKAKQTTVQFNESQTMTSKQFFPKPIINTKRNTSREQLISKIKIQRNSLVQKVTNNSVDKQVQVTIKNKSVILKCLFCKKQFQGKSKALICTSCRTTKPVLQSQNSVRRYFSQNNQNHNTQFYNNNRNRFKEVNRTFLQPKYHVYEHHSRKYNRQLLSPLRRQRHWMFSAQRNRRYIYNY